MGVRATLREAGCSSLQKRAVTTSQVAWMPHSGPQQCCLSEDSGSSSPCRSPASVLCPAPTLPQLFLASGVSSSSQNPHSTGARTEGGSGAEPRLRPSLCAPQVHCYTHYPWNSVLQQQYYRMNIKSTETCYLQRLIRNKI